MSAHGTLVSMTSREPVCRVRIVRQYTHATKVRYWMGDGWSDVQDAHPEDVLEDGGALAGWRAVDYTSGIQR